MVTDRYQHASISAKPKTANASRLKPVKIKNSLKIAPIKREIKFQLNA